MDGELWDLDRPLEKDCSLQLLKFDDEEGILILYQAFWEICHPDIQYENQQPMHMMNARNFT